MSVRGKEVDVLVVDVGPSMHAHLGNVSKCLCNYALSKILNKPSHETVLVLAGSDKTNSSLAEESGPGQYEHIDVAQEMRCPNQATLDLLMKLPQSGGSHACDFIDALMVVADLVIKASAERVLEKVPKKVILISNLAHEPPALDEDFQAQLTQSFRAQTTQLHVICLPLPGDAAPAARDARKANLETLRGLMAEAGGQEIRFVHQPSDLLGAFRLKEVSNTCVKMDFEVGKSLKLRVRVYKKAAFVKLPSLKEQALNDDSTLADVVTSREYFPPSAADEENEGQEGAGAGTAAAGGDVAMADAQPVDPSEQLKAFRYGKQYVPIDDIGDTKYVPGRCLQLKSLVKLEHLLQDQRYMFLGDPQMLLPEKDENSQVALSAFVRGLHNKKKAAVVRYARTVNAQVDLYALLPELGSATVPDHLVMVKLPFADDVRTFTLPPLVPKKELMPTSEQNNAAMKLVQKADLVSGTKPSDGGDGGGARELLKPEETANPVLQRFYTALGRLVVAPAGEDYTGREEELPGPASQDPLVQGVLGAQWDKLKPDALAAASAFTKAFPTQAVEHKKKGGKEDEAVAGLFGNAQAADAAAASGSGAAVVLSDEHPVEDFKEHVEAGRLAPAAAALGNLVLELVEKSVKDRLYGKALDCMAAMRQACVDKANAAPYNDFVRSVKDKYEKDSGRAAFWQLVVERRLGLISSLEVASSSVRAEEAQAFVQQQQEAPKATVQEREVIELDDELDEME